MPSLQLPEQARAVRGLLWFAGSVMISAGVAASDVMERGAAIYSANCAACHQPLGEGIEPVFPALAGSEFVAGDAPEVAGVISNGRAAMPAYQQDITMEDIAAVTTYIRQSWGNNASEVDVELVEKATIQIEVDETARARDDDF